MGQEAISRKLFSQKVTESSNRNPFHLVERDVVARPVVELRRPRRFVRLDRLGVLDHAPVLEDMLLSRSPGTRGSTWSRGVRLQAPACLGRATVCVFVR